MNMKYSSTKRFMKNNYKQGMVQWGGAQNFSDGGAGLDGGGIPLSPLSPQTGKPRKESKKCLIFCM